MNTTKITEAETASLRISSLPTRPTAPEAFGGKGYTATEMKAAFDRLPLFIIERFNSLLDDIVSNEDGISESISTGLDTDHTLADLFEDIKSGRLAGYMSVFDQSLTAELTEIKAEISELKERLSEGL